MAPDRPLVAPLRVEDHEMVEFEVTRGMPAVSEVVFQSAADPARFGHWLPPVIEVEPAGQDGVHVESEVGGHHQAEGLLRSDPDERRVEWANQGSTEYHGWLQVADAGAGASEATLHLEFATEEATHGATPDQIETWMRESLDRLATEVTGQVNDAS